MRGRFRLSGSCHPPNSPIGSTSPNSYWFESKSVRSPLEDDLRLILEPYPSLISLDCFATPEPQMIIVVALHIHHPASMPERRPPAAPIRMSVGRIEDEPAAFHLRVAKLQAVPARHLALI